MNRLKTLMFIALAVLVALGCSDTAWADGVTLTVTPTSLAFNNVPSNSMSQPQTLQISSNQNTSVVIQTTQSWISISTSVLNIGTTATPVTVRANTSGLAQGSYTGSIVVTVAGQTSINQTVSVSLSVSGTSLLTANPSMLSFSAQAGATSATPTSAPVQIISSGAALNYTLTAQTQSGGNWLLLTTLSGTTGGAGFSVSVNPSGLAAASYTGTITAQSTTTADSVQISVTLAVNTSATLSVSPATPSPFLWQIGTPNPAAQQLTVSAANGTVQFSVNVSPPVTWLVVSPLSGQAGTNPTTVSLIPNPAGAALTAGSYTTNVIISSGSNQVTVPVKLIAASHALLQLSTNSLAFSGGFASQQSPPDQTVMVTASDASTQSFNYTSDSAWLTLKTTGGFATSGSGATPATLTVHVSPAGLQVGTYNGTIQVQPTNGDSYTETITVSFAVGSASTLQAGPQNLLFSYQTGQIPPGVQNIIVVSTGQPIAFTVATSTTVTSNCPGGWLNATPSSGTTQATITVSVSVSGLSAGLCSGAITLNYNSGTGQASVPLGVSLAISAADKPELTVSVPTAFGLESAALGAQFYSRTIALGSTNLGTSVDFSATAISTGGTWLTVGPGSGNTPQNLLVGIQPSVLTSPGQYTGSITISSTTLPAQLVIPILLTITSNVNVTVAPTSLSFTEAQLGPLPAAQNLTLTSTGGTASFTSSIQYNSGSNWLQVTPGSGTASGNLQVSIQPNSLSQGTYTAQITLAYQGASSAGAVIPVTLTVGPQQTLSVAPSSLTFSSQIGGTQPPAQSLALTTTGGAVQFSLGTTSSGWLVTDITSGSAPRNVSVSVNTTGLTAGTYMGSISITAPNVLTNAIVVNVTLTVAAAPVPQPVTISSAASFQFGVVAPGELITIKGSQLGPASPPNGVSFTLNSQGGVDSKLAGVRVLFDNNPGTPIYVSAGQINVIVPWEIAGRPSTNMVVEVNGIQSGPIPLTLTNQAPGLFTTTQNGAGQVAAINQNGTYNGPPGNGFSPAAVGSVISVYGTGGGQTSPPGTTGSVTPTPTSAAGPFLRIFNVTATIGNQPATVTFAGAAPGLVTGVIQINIMVPPGVSGNSVPISVSINGVATPLVGTTVAVSGGG